MVALLLVFTILGSAAAVRLGYWQIMAGPELAARAARSLPQREEDIPPRAEIVDRDGKPLAQTAMLDQLVAHPDLVPEERVEDLVRELGDIMGLGSAAAREAYGAKLASGRRYSILESRITPEQSLAVRLALDERRLSGITLQPRQVRVYPHPGGVDGTSLAAQLLGFVDADGRGRYGIEQAYDDRLTGRASGPLDLASLGPLPAADGAGDGTLSPFGVAPMRLTLDAGLQRQLERELAAAKLANGSPRVSGLVMDPYTGEILAWASVPSYDANRYREEVAARGLTALRDPIASDTYEPGSVMKPLTVAAALDAGVVKPTTKIQDARKIEFYGHTVRNADHDTMGTLSVKDVVAYSRNLAVTRIAERLGPTTEKSSRRLYRMWQRLGIDSPTGIDVAAEAAGISHDPRERPWAPVDLSNKAFGQGVAVTLVQLAVAYAAMVNGGYRVTPHMVQDGEAAAVEPERVLSPKVAKQLRGILEHVTGWVSTYAAGSLIFGHTVGGKTGTAQFWNSARGRISKNVFNFSFIGFVGSDDPRVIIAVRIHETKAKVLGQGEIELNVTSYELFRKIAKAAIKHLEIPKGKGRDVGYPVPRSPADRVLTPDRYRQHVRIASTRRKAARRESASAAGRASKRSAQRRGGRDGERRRARDRSAATAAGDPSEGGAGREDGAAGPVGAAGGGGDRGRADDRAGP